MSNFLTRKQFMEVFSVSKPTVNNLINRGMPHFRIGSDLRFVEEECVQWFKENTNKKGDK